MVCIIRELSLSSLMIFLESINIDADIVTYLNDGVGAHWREHEWDRTV